MKLRKNLEAVFLVAAAMAMFASYATADVPTQRAAKPALVSAPVADSAMQVVVIKGHRLSAAEKAQLN